MESLSLNTTSDNTDFETSYEIEQVSSDTAPVIFSLLLFFLVVVAIIGVVAYLSVQVETLNVTTQELREFLSLLNKNGVS